MSLGVVEKQVTRKEVAALPLLHRRHAVRYFRQATTMLHVHETTMATAVVLLRRYEDGVRARSAVPELQTTLILCAAVLFLACKAEEQPRRLRNVVNVSFYIADPEKRVPDLDMKYWTLKSAIVANEQVILRELAFDVAVQHPHPLILNYAHMLRVPACVVEVAIAVANDSYFDPQCHTLDVSRTAAAALVIALRVIPSAAAQSVKLPVYAASSWWRAFGISDEGISSQVDRILAIYATSAPPNGSGESVAAPSAEAAGSGAAEAAGTRAPTAKAESPAAGTSAPPQTGESKGADADGVRGGCALRAPSGRSRPSIPIAAVAESPPPAGSARGTRAASGGTGDPRDAADSSSSRPPAAADAAAEPGTTAPPPESAGPRSLLSAFAPR